MSCKGPQGTPCNVGKNSTFLDATGKKINELQLKTSTNIVANMFVGHYSYGKTLKNVSQSGPSGTVAHYHRRSD